MVRILHTVHHGSKRAFFGVVVQPFSKPQNYTFIDAATLLDQGDY